MEFLIFLLHIVIDFEMNMYEAIHLSFDHAREEMLEYLDILAMDTDEKCTIRSLNSYIDIFSYLFYCYARSSYTELAKKICNK